MNNYTSSAILRLLARNEGRIKSHESCTDVRAWSHDGRVRDRYLREWIKCDMPICVIPISTFTHLLRTMTCGSRSRATPQCHPNCKSKVLLESICNSCHAMKECLKNNEHFEKYFEEEEFETSTWPCERCLEALKSIKMFWKIIIEKLFNINISKNEEVDKVVYSSTESVKSIAKVWQNEMVQQALFVKNVTPLLTRLPRIRRYSDPWKNTLKNDTNPTNEKPNHKDDEQGLKTVDKSRTSCCITKSHKAKSTDTNLLTNKEKRYKKRNNKCISVKVKMMDVGCETCNIKVENELIMCKTNLEYLQERYNTQNDEMERLRQENNSLKLELQNFYKCCPWKTEVCAPSLKLVHDTVAVLPQPFDSYLNESIPSNAPKDIDSEMIITMRNCKNENFRHVSLLQVLHKTNERISSDSIPAESCSKKEDPIYLLAKVQNTFGAIVRREMSLASERRHRPQKTDIEATFHRMSTSRSAPSCSTLSSYSSSNFMSTNKESENNQPLFNVL